jgi:hypothetical protein
MLRGVATLALLTSCAGSPTRETLRMRREFVETLSVDLASKTQPHGFHLMANEVVTLAGTERDELVVNLLECGAPLLVQIAVASRAELNRLGIAKLKCRPDMLTETDRGTISEPF